MSNDLWRRLAEKLHEHSYMDGVERTVERVRATAEIFTPTPLVIEILQYLNVELFSPGRTVLDPACGDGQFLVAAKWLKVFRFRMTEEEALNDIYGIDLMRDNVDLCKRRLGGGTIVMGNTLKPGLRLLGQTDEEHHLMLSLFAESGDERPTKGRIAQPKSSSKQDKRKGELVRLF